PRGQAGGGLATLVAEGDAALDEREEQCELVGRRPPPLVDDGEEALGEDGDVAVASRRAHGPSDRRRCSSSSGVTNWTLSPSPSRGGFWRSSSKAGRISAIGMP